MKLKNEVKVTESSLTESKLETNKIILVENNEIKLLKDEKRS